MNNTHNNIGAFDLAAGELCADREAMLSLVAKEGRLDSSKHSFY